jgi:hypothetical protein
VAIAVPVCSSISRPSNPIRRGCYISSPGVRIRVSKWKQALRSCNPICTKASNKMLNEINNSFHLQLKLNILSYTITGLYLKYSNSEILHQILRQRWAWAWNYEQKVKDGITMFRIYTLKSWAIACKCSCEEERVSRWMYIFNQPCGNLGACPCPCPFKVCSLLKGGNSLGGPLILVMPVSGLHIDLQ